MDAPGSGFRRHLEAYVARLYGEAARVESVVPLGEEGGEKEYGYGVPLQVTLSGAPVREVVLHTVRAAPGHETLADRAASALLSYETFNHLPRHVRALDVGAMKSGGEWVSLDGASDFYLLTTYAEGEPYFLDLERIAETDAATDADRRRVDVLAAYLARIHADHHAAPPLYLRRIRELFGHHECILGILDTYDGFPLEPFTSDAQIRDIERRCVDWRHRLKRYPHRLCRVHGDYHPWNVLWQDEGELAVLDRSRGEWGDGADDVSCMAINYLFFALRQHGRFAGPLRDLWDRFFERYLAAAGDEEIGEVLPPYFVWRALVLASPLWYPHLDAEVRRTLFRFVDRVLSVERFDYRAVDALLEAN